MMRILHVLPSRAADYGGPVQVAESLGSEAERNGCMVTILPDVARKHLDVLGTYIYWPGWRGLRDIAGQVSIADIVHVHGLWTIPATVACSAARHHAKPYLVTAHGMLDSWSLSRSRRKKLLYASLIERRNLDRAAALHFVSDSEHAEARSWGVLARPFVIPNGIDPDEFNDLPTRQALYDRVPQARGKIIVLFLGRLHPKKGLDVLIPAFADALSANGDLHLLIAGPDEGGYRVQVDRWITQHDIAEAATIMGPVYGSAKRIVLGGADIFALSSHEEADSIAIKEAMASRLPVLISHQCRLPEVSTHKAGLVTATTRRETAEALLTLGASAQLRGELGANGVRLIRERYALPQIGRRMLDVYADILENHTSSPAWRT